MPDDIAVKRAAQLSTLKDLAKGIVLSNAVLSTLKTKKILDVKGLLTLEGLKVSADKKAKFWLAAKLATLCGNAGLAEKGYFTFA
jgi:hypothetical protein